MPWRPQVATCYSKGHKLVVTPFFQSPTRSTKRVLPTSCTKKIVSTSCESQIPLSRTFCILQSVPLSSAVSTLRAQRNRRRVSQENTFCKRSTIWRRKRNRCDVESVRTIAFQGDHNLAQQKPHGVSCNKRIPQGVSTIWRRMHLTSSKLRPVVAGYRMDSLSFLSGPMIHTARALAGRPLLQEQPQGLISSDSFDQIIAS